MTRNARTAAGRIRNSFRHASQQRERMPLNDALSLPILRDARPNPATLFRWCMRGVRGVRLNHTRVGGRIFVTASDVERFLAAINQSTTPTVRAPIAANVDAELDALGVK